jgi:spore germination protein GerM
MSRAATTVTIILTAIVAAALIIVRTGPTIGRDPSQGRTGIGTPEQVDARPQERDVTLFFANAAATRLVEEPRRVSFVAGHSGALAEAALAALIAGSQRGNAPVLPAGLATPRVFVASATAYVDMPAEIQDANYGAAGELLAVYAIVYTVGRLPEIERVKILIAGAERATLAGHVALADTFTATSPPPSFGP